MPTATVTSKGQVTIPKEVREAVGINPGDKLNFTVREDGIIEVQPRNISIMALCGILEPRVRGVTIEDMQEAIIRGATES